LFVVEPIVVHQNTPAYTTKTQDLFFETMHSKSFNNFDRSWKVRMLNRLWTDAAQSLWN